MQFGCQHEMSFGLFTPRRRKQACEEEEVKNLSLSWRRKDAFNKTRQGR